MTINLASALHVHLDYETYSKANLKEVGAYRYARDPSTDVLLASYKYTGAEEAQRKPFRWRPGAAYPFESIHDRLGKDAFILAWNAGFERAIWYHVMAERYDWPDLPVEAFICVAAWARDAAASPAALEHAAPFFDVKYRKDHKGHLHMLKMCRPATDSQQLKWREAEDGRALYAVGATDEEMKYSQERCHHTPENIERLHEYCDIDVDVETAIAEILPEWPEQSIREYWAGEHVNDRGVAVDVSFAKAAAAYADEEKADLKDRLVAITEDASMTPRTFARFKEWALPGMADDAVKLCQKYDKGELKYTFDASTRAKLIHHAEGYPDDIDEDVLEAIEILDEAGKSTISKYENIARRACKDDMGVPRVHGLYMHAGAAQSGRYSSVGLQAHNLVRAVPDNADDIIHAFIEADEEQIRSFGKPIHVLGKLVRPTLTGCPDGDYDLSWSDWSSVEAIALPWLTLDPAAEEGRLSTFRRGEDIYLKTASSILKRTITKEDAFERQAYGKVPDLSLGYLGGEGALAAMARNYGVHLTRAERDRIVQGWRKANPWAMDFGNACEKAAKLALKYPGNDYSAGRLSYRYLTYALDGLGALFCTLPSGREIAYPDPKIETVKKAWGNVVVITCRKGSWTMGKDGTEWPRVQLWKGLLVENATQATCADLLRRALVRCAEEDLYVVAHTHDEIIIQTDTPSRDERVLHDIMVERPGWPGDDALPLRAEAESGYRYKVKFGE